MRAVADKAPGIAFLAMFPGFFMYHYLAGIEAIPLFAGGWASNANLVAALILAPTVAFLSFRSNRFSHHIPAGLFVAVVLGYALFFWRVGDEYQRDPELVVHAVKLVLGLVATYCVGVLMPMSPAIRSAVVSALAIMVLAVVFHTDWQGLSFSIPERKVPTGKVSDYQGFATAFAITAVFSVAVIRKLSWLLVAVLASTACLFMIGARGDMLGFGLAVCALTFVALVRRDYLRGAVLPLAYVAPIIILLALPSVGSMIGGKAEPVKPSVEAEGGLPAKRGPEIKGNFRNEELLDIASSQSLGIRMEVLRTGWSGIVASPFVGDYAGQVRDHGQFGMYVHNILSAWRQFGLVGFLLYSGLCLGAVGYSAWAVVIRGDDSFLMVATLLVAVYSVGLIFLTKSVFWPMPALAWGMAAARYRERQKPA